MGHDWLLGSSIAQIENKDITSAALRKFYLTSRTFPQKALYMLFVNEFTKTTVLQKVALDSSQASLLKAPNSLLKWKNN